MKTPTTAKKIAKMDRLILDNFGLTHLEQQQRLDLMEPIEDRLAKASTIIASQLTVANWYDVIGKKQSQMRFSTAWFTLLTGSS